MSIDPGPHLLDHTRPIFSPTGDARLKAVTPNFYEELGQDFPDFAGHILLQRFEFSDPWPTWEIHPKGHEFVYLLSGDVDFVLWENGQEKTVRVNEPGSYVMVPKNTWHTARPHKKTSMLFVTAGEGTMNAEQPA